MALGGGVLGLAGPDAAVAALARLLVIQAAVLHSPAELEVVTVLADAEADWEWAAWLPHAPRDAVAVGSGAGRALCEEIAAAGRRALVVVDGALRLEPALLARVAEEGGGTVICLGRDAHGLPGTCTHVVELAHGRAMLRVVDVAAGTEVDEVSAEGMAPDAAEEVARLLAPVDDAGAEGGPGAIPARVSLLELLDMPEPTGATLAQRWLASGDDLRAPIGVTADGLFEVDAGRTEGLRLLLAGMPGAGKSELLQALIASLAALHPPDRLTFLLVDYKGGAAFRDAVRLPHAVGLVTDLDQHLAERARASLLAELRRREALLERHAVRSLRELRSTRPEAAPPALLSSSTSSPRSCARCPRSSRPSSTSRSAGAAWACTSSWRPSVRAARSATRSARTPTFASRCASPIAPRAKTSSKRPTPRRSQPTSPGAPSRSRAVTPTERLR